MAVAVASALEEDRHLIVEAGTGTGKTLAYLVPLMLAGKRAVVSTGTKNLQEQLVRKDVPFLSGVLNRDIDVAVMKGRNNFLCLQKLRDMEGKPTLAGLDDLTEFGLVRKWARTTAIGDRSELRELPEGSKLWPRLDARRETCSGRSCELFEDCFISKMHWRAREADIIIVNHHLFFADLALRRDDFGSIIPDYQVVVFDEAHEIESVAGQFFGVRLSNLQVDEVARDVQAAASGGGFGSEGLTRSLNGLRATSRTFFDLFKDLKSRKTFSDRTQFRNREAGKYRALLSSIQGLESRLHGIKDRSEDTAPFIERVRDLRLVLQVLLADVTEAVEREAHAHPVLGLLVEDQRESFVYWLEKRGRGVYIQATPIEVNSILQQSLFGEGASVVLASATLAVNETFDFVRGRLGLASSDELLVAGEFDYRNQTILYLPRDMPEPRSDEFGRRATERIRQLLAISEGRAFVLCTSIWQMRRLHEKVSESVDYPCLVQGQGANAAVLEQFRSTPNCVLFATYSFWQGVDVPGEQLSCVIVDKLPFAVPTDPVVKARCDQIERSGESPFFRFQIPSAALTLKQGFGRLIRRSTDRGVLALLDSRVATKPYGRIFLRSLPDYAVTHRLEDVKAFFDGGRSGRGYAGTASSSATASSAKSRPSSVRRRKGCSGETHPRAASAAMRGSSASHSRRSRRMPSDVRSPVRTRSSRMRRGPSSSNVSRGEVPDAIRLTYSGALATFAQRRAPSNECASLPNPR